MVKEVLTWLVIITSMIIIGNLTGHLKWTIQASIYSLLVWSIASIVKKIFLDED